MKAITIHQPYASLIAVGAKRYETRSWATRYRGQIATHAGKQDWTGRMSSEEITAAINAFTGTRYEVASGRAENNYDYIYPYGAVIATAELVDCIKIIETTEIYKPELLFGDFTAGRYIWVLANVKMFPEPIPERGKQGLWEWESDYAVR